MIADLYTLLTALYVELTDRIIPFREPGRRGPGRPPEVTDAELACLAVAQVLLRCDDERHWLRAAPRLVGHLFPRLLAQSQYNTRLRQIAPLMEAALRWLADANTATAELLRLMDATPVPCGHLRRHRETLRPVRARRLRVGLWAPIIQRLLALNACIWHNWLIGAPVKRSLRQLALTIRAANVIFRSRTASERDTIPATPRTGSDTAN